MPLYEYLCEACGLHFEVIQKFSETSETCRLCGKGPVHRQISAGGFQFKGTGWYVTDYAQKGKSDGESAGTGKGDSTEKTDAKKPDTASGDTASKSESPTASTAGTTPKG
jgi:putative FmdB family regulatory protein